MTHPARAQLSRFRRFDQTPNAPIWRDCRQRHDTTRQSLWSRVGILLCCAPWCFAVALGEQDFASTREDRARAVSADGADGIASPAVAEGERDAATATASDDEATLERRGLDALTAPRSDTAQLSGEMAFARALSLFEEGDGFVEKKEYRSALEVWVRAYFHRLPAYRSRDFHGPVEAKFLSRTDLGSYLLAEIDKEHTAEDFEADALGLRVFGFIDDPIDLRKIYIDLLTEQIAGFYDPQVKALFLIADLGEKPEKRSLWSRVFGGGKEFDPAEQRSVLSHELAHALADQHFDLYSLSRSAEHDDDLALAVSALIEGEAMVVMILDLVAADEEDPEARLPSIDSVVSLLSGVNSLAGAWGGAGPALRDAPLVLRESLIFPYMSGMKFCAGLVSGHRRGWTEVDLAFRAPPISTEQVLHPEKFPHDVPLALSYVGADPLVAAGWELIDQNTLGEFQTELLLRRSSGSRRPSTSTSTATSSRRAAEGWDGDTYRVYRGAAGLPDSQIPVALVWATTWDTRDDAVEFADALADFAEFVHGAPPFEGDEEGSRFRSASHIEWGDEVAESRIDLSELDVIWCHRVPRGAAPAVFPWARSFERAEKKLVIETHEVPARTKVEAGTGAAESAGKTSESETRVDKTDRSER
jgi:hypothetical protein